MDDSFVGKTFKQMKNKSNNICVGDLLKSRSGRDLYVVISERTTVSGKRELLLSGHLYHIWDLIVEKEFILLSEKE